MLAHTTLPWQSIDGRRDTCVLFLGFAFSMVRVGSGPGSSMARTKSGCLRIKAAACPIESSPSNKPETRWTFLKTKWLPLLQDLYRTVGVLDREESALQALEQKEEEEAEQAAAAAAEAKQTSGGEAKGSEAARYEALPGSYFSPRYVACLFVVCSLGLHTRFPYPTCPRLS